MLALHTIPILSQIDSIYYAQLEIIQEYLYGVSIYILIWNQFTAY